MLLFLLLTIGAGVGELALLSKSLSEKESTHLSGSQPMWSGSGKTTQDGYARLGHRINPSITCNTERYANISLMLRLPINRKQHIWWVDPNLQELGQSLFEGVDNNSLYDTDRAMRIGIGTGYRCFVTPAWILGGYFYYDYNQCSGSRLVPMHMGAGFCSWDFNTHTVNLGVESYFLKWRTIGNAYFSSSPSDKLQRVSYTQWEADYKIEKDFQRITIGLGAFYKHTRVTHLQQDIISHQDHALHAMPCKGGMAECQYKSKFRTYSAKYTYDTLGEHRFSIGVQWLFLEPLNIHSTHTLQASLSRPVARYLAASIPNAKEGRKRFEKINAVAQHHRDAHTRNDKSINDFYERFIAHILKQRSSNGGQYGFTTKKLELMSRITSEENNFGDQEIPLLKRYQQELTTPYLRPIARYSSFPPWHHLYKRLKSEQEQASQLLSEDHPSAWDVIKIIRLLRGLYIPSHAVLKRIDQDPFSSEQIQILKEARQYVGSRGMDDELSSMESTRPWLLSREKKEVFNNIKRRNLAYWEDSVQHAASDRESLMFLELEQISRLYQASLKARKQWALHDMNRLAYLGEVAEDVRRCYSAAEVLTRCDPSLRAQMLQVRLLNHLL